MSAGSLLIEARDLRKTYRRGPEEVHALDGVSFALSPGEVVALMGPSGSGKTTLLNVVCGWETPDTGEVRWSDDGASSRERSATKPWGDLAIVPQDIGLLEELSVRENVDLPQRLSGTTGPDAARRVEALLRAFGLDSYADRQPGETSLGEQQRIALARAMILSPRLFLADEPTGHQDAGWAQVVFRSLRWLAARGTCCLIATHSGEFLRYVDRVLAMRDGRLEGTTRISETLPPDR
jgi:putative ABC transport system ATP-binding protein